LADSDRSRLSVSLVEVSEGYEAELQALLGSFGALVAERGYGRADVVRDESDPRRFYAVRRWVDADAAERCHRDKDVQALTLRIYQIARVTHVVNGVRRPEEGQVPADERRARFEPDRRSGFDRRVRDVGSPGGERRGGRDRRLGPRRVRDRPGGVDLVAAARRAREHADAAFSGFRVGAALETADGTVVSGCNIENATFGLTMCAERVAMFKALSEGHRAFSRLALVADSETPVPPCGACRQILWEFGGNLDVTLANLTMEQARYRLSDLLPVPFDARLL
jgi:cytidine deaminase